jgi:hypothetical protein
VSSIIILVLFLLIAAPAIWAFLRRDVGWATGGFYAAAAMGLLAWHVGFSIGAVPDISAFARPPAATLDETQCERALTAAERARIVLDRSDPNRLVVSGEAWPQLPENLRIALTECSGAVRSPNRRGSPVEVVTR